MTRLSPAILLLATVLALPARAVDLTKQTLGIGAVSEFASDAAHAPPQLSLRVPLKPRLVAAVLFGLQIAPGATFVPGLQVDYVLIPEEHMNLYATVAFALDVHSSGGLQAFDYRFGPSAELFFSEFPNLGLLLGFGIDGALVPGANTFERPGLSTTLSPFATAGAHYYF